MVLPENRGTVTPMSAAADVLRSHRAARRLVEIEQLRTGLTADEARERVAGREGVSPGTFENIVRKRIKGVEGWLRDKLQAALIRELQAELARLEHELAVARLSAQRPDDDEISSVMALVERAKELLKRSV